MMNKDERRTLVSGMISGAIDRLAPHKTQKELAREMGFVKPQMLSMLRTGAAQMPFVRIPDIAAVLGIDPATLLKAHLMQCWPEFELVVHEIFGGILTQGEREWIEFFESVGMTSPPMNLAKRQKLVEILQAEDWEEADEG